jgi:putative NIF3 family GTP cyclohydrolase 1 type 2
MKALSVLILCIPSLLLQGQNSTIGKGSSANEITQAIIKNTGVTPFTYYTNDIFKAGDPSTPVTGIITCMFAPMDVLKKAVDKNCNLIIVHEPIYFNGADETKELENDPVFLEKKQYIEDHKLVIWRFHDYIHTMKPDGILTGMVTKLGWGNFQDKNNLNLFVLPEMTLKGLLKNLKKVFPKHAFYVMGDPKMKITRVWLSPGADNYMFHCKFIQQADVVIAGESPQWESYEYMRDAIQQGRNKATIFLGHTNSEESGMKFASEWLKTFIKEIPIYYIEEGPSFWSY